MGLNPGDQICYRVMPEISRYNATIATIDDRTVTLRLHADAPAAMNRGHYVMLTEPDTDTEHYSEVQVWDGKTVQLKRIWTGKRGFFRVDDAFPVLHEKVDNGSRRDARIFSSTGATLESAYTPDDSVSPQLWNMLSDINTKLTMILERLNLEQEGLSRARPIPVNISASGIRLTIPYKVEIDDVLELKMLIPMYPPVGVLVHGTVVRVEKLDSGEFGASLSFIGLTDEVQDVIIQYTLKRQRELIHRERQWDQEP